MKTKCTHILRCMSLLSFSIFLLFSSSHSYSTTPNVPAPTSTPAAGVGSSGNSAPQSSSSSSSRGAALLSINDPGPLPTRLADVTGFTFYKPRQSKEDAKTTPPFRYYGGSDASNPERYNRYSHRVYYNNWSYKQMKRLYTNLLEMHINWCRQLRGSEDSPRRSENFRRQLSWHRKICYADASHDPAYRVNGTCDSSLGDVRVSIGSRGTHQYVSCEKDNTFEARFGANILLVSVADSPAKVVASQEQAMGRNRSLTTKAIISVANEFPIFITRWNIPSDNYSFTLPLKPGLNYNFLVHWGDGAGIDVRWGETYTITSFDDADKTFVYSNRGDTIIMIIGTMEGFQNTSDERGNLYEVSKLGNMGWKDLSEAFSGNIELRGVYGGNTSKVTNMSAMFAGASVVHPDTIWDTSNVTNMSAMFANAFVSQPNTSNWDTSKVTNMSAMFENAQYPNPNTSNWDTSKVTNMSSMFKNTQDANPNTSNWDTSKVTNMSAMFANTHRANPNTSSWDTSKVTNMSAMFANNIHRLNPNTSSWDTSKVTNMSYMFADNTKANPDTSNWDTSKVTNMSAMFKKALRANPNTSSWDFTQVQSLARQLDHVSFLTYGAGAANSLQPGKFHTPIQEVAIPSSERGLASVFKSPSLSVDNYSKFLIRLDQKPPTSSNLIKVIDVGTLKYKPSAINAREGLAEKGWSITDGGPDAKDLYFDSISLPVLSQNNARAYKVRGSCDPDLGNVTITIGVGDSKVVKEFTCNSDNTFLAILDLRNIVSPQVTIRSSQGTGDSVFGVSKSFVLANDMNHFVTEWSISEPPFTFTLPLKPGLRYNFTVDWGDGSSKSEVTSFDDSDKVHTYQNIGKVTIKITGLVEGFHNSFDNGLLHNNLLLKVLNLGNMGWKDLSHAFENNVNLTVFRGGNTSNVTNMSHMFNGATKANPDTSGWDTSRVFDMSAMFSEAARANPDTSGWDTSHVVTMGHMFSKTTLANPDTSGWDTSRVVNMEQMFLEATQADPDTSGWDFQSLYALAPQFTDLPPELPEPVVRGSRRIFFNTFRSSGLSVENYSKFLISLNEKPPKNNSLIRKINVGTLKANLSAFGARASLLEQDWTINDGGIDNQEIYLDTTSFPPISLSNAGAYRIQGSCNSDFGKIRVVAGEPRVQKELTCNADNTFIGIFNLQNIYSHPVKFTVSQGATGSVSSKSFELANEMNRFITEWKLPQGDFTLPLKPGLEYNFTVDWGDKSAVSEVTSFGDSDKVHRYAQRGEYIITITGLVEGFQNNNRSLGYLGTAHDLLSVLVLGDMGWKDLSRAFEHNGSLGIFRGGNTSNVTNMSFMFSNALLVKPDTRGWDTSNVTDMRNMFQGAASANPDASGWDTSNVTDMRNMFQGAASANPDASGWDTSNVTNMYSMFQGAASANPDTSGWDFRNVNFVQGNNRGLTDIFKLSILSVDNYSKFLIAIDKKTPTTSTGIWKKIDVGTLKCNGSAAEARKRLIHNGWTLTDGGDCHPDLSMNMAALSPLSSSNQGSYTVSGTCQTHLGNVNIVVGNPEVEKSLPCVGSLFSGAIDLQSVYSHEVTIAISQAGSSSTVSHTLVNKTNQFVTVWGIRRGDKLTLPLKKGLKYDFTVDWGDGTTGRVTSFKDADKKHTYPPSNTAKKYVVIIKGTVEGLKSNDFSKTNLFEVINLGHMGWKDLSNAFTKNTRLTKVLGGNTSDVTNMDRMFFKASLLETLDTSGWDTSSLVSMNEIFKGATKVNPDVSGWDTSQVENMVGVFDGATQANPDTSGWDFSKVRTSTSSKHSGVGSLQALFRSSGLSVENYSKFLIALDERRPNTQDFLERVINVGLLKYNTSAESARGNLVSHWIITDGGLEGAEGNINVPILAPNGLQPLSLANGGIYGIQGTCNANDGDVTVVIGEPNMQKDLACADNNAFSGSFDVQHVSSHPVTITISQDQGSVVVSESVANRINRFVTKWEIPSANYVFTLPLKDNLNYDFTVDWGDNTPTSEVTSFDDDDKEHTYANSESYTITITGTVEGFENNAAPLKGLLVEVTNLGHMGWKDLSYAFRNNSFLVAVFGGNTSNVTDMSQMFDGARKATPDTSGWDTSSVTNMSYMFSSAMKATPDTSDWDTSSVTNMSYMFSSAMKATPDTSDWDTSSVTNMSYMFSRALKATPDTSGWDTSSVTNMTSMFSSATRATPDTSGWDTSSVTNMTSMFYAASQANPDINGWDISNVTHITSMFKGAENADPDTSRWDFSNIVSMNKIFEGVGLSIANYSKFLIRINEKTPKHHLHGPTVNKRISVYKLRYNSSATSARTSLKSKGWTITDGGLQ